MSSSIVRRLLLAAVAMSVSSCSEELLEPETPEPIDIDLVTREDLRSATLARDDSLFFSEDPHSPGGSIELDVLANDRGAGLRVASCDCETDLGQITLQDGRLTLAAGEDVFGSDSIEYTAVGSDSFGVATAVILLRPVNDPPVANPEHPGLSAALKKVGDDTTLSLSSVFIDSDGDPLHYRIDPEEPTNSVEPDSAGVLVVVVAREKGLETVFIIAVDDSLAESDPAALHIMVGNRPPENFAALPMLDLFVGQSDTLDLVNFFRDPDGDPLAFTAASNEGSVEAAVDGSTVIVTAVSPTSTALVTIEATDGEESVSAAISVTVRENAPPSFVPTETEEVFKRTETTYGATDLFSDDASGELELRILDGPSSGLFTASLVETPPGLLIATGSDVGTDSVRVEADDGFNTGSGTLVVAVVNRPPILIGSDIEMVDAFVGIETILSLDDYFVDPDGDSLQFGVDTAFTQETVLGVVVEGTRNQNVRVSPVGSGTTQFQANADDGFTDETLPFITFTVMVQENPAPRIRSGLDSLLVTQDSTINLLDFVEDPGPAQDQLSIDSVTVVDDGEANITIDASGLPVVAIDTAGAGVDTLRISASDLSSTQDLRLFVRVTSSAAALGSGGGAGDADPRLGMRGINPRRE